MTSGDDGKRVLPRNRPAFAAQSARAESSRFGPEERSQIESAEQFPSYHEVHEHSDSLNGAGNLASSSPSQKAGPIKSFLGDLPKTHDDVPTDNKTTDAQGRRSSITFRRRTPLGHQAPHNLEDHDKNEKDDKLPGRSGAPSKLGTFSGVFVPTTLNVLSILMFLRFGFVLGQSGFLGMMGIQLSPLSSMRIILISS